MATQKPISTISYNTKEFLFEKLDDWYNAHIIQAYQVIFHKGEDGDKDHFHLRIEPNKPVDKMVLTEELAEYDPKHPTKPLCVRPWRPSKEEDWYLYAVHDKEYLDMKYDGGERGEKLPYSIDDVVVSRNYDKEIAWIRAKSYLKHSSANITKRILEGESVASMAMKGENVFLLNGAFRLTQNQAIDNVKRERDHYKRLLLDLKKSLHDIGIDAYNPDGNEWIIEYIDMPFDDTRTQNESAGAKVTHGEENI